MQKTKQRGKYGLIVKRFCRHRLAVGCLVILAVLILMAVLAVSIWIIVRRKKML